MARSLNKLFTTFLIFAMALAITPLQPVSAAPPTELFFSEYIEGSSNNKALEIYNGTENDIDLAAGGYSVQMFSNGSSSVGTTFALTGTVTAGDVYVVAHASAVAEILAQADQTSTASWFNGNDAVALVKGTDFIDVIGQIGTDPGSQWGTDPASTADNTLNRKAEVCAGDPDGSNAFDPSIEWDGSAVNTFTGLGVHVTSCEPLGPIEPVINEFSASTTGTDVEFVEFFGTPDTDYLAYTLLEIEGDISGTVIGTVDEVISLGTTDANGLQLINLAANALENGSLSLLLVKNFTGALGNDLDTDDDGNFDVMPWDALVDSIAVNDGGAGDITYGTTTLGVAYDGAAFAPGGASRIPDGTDTNSTADWVRNDFDLAGIPGFTGTPVAGEALNTPGAFNEAITASSNTVTIEATDGDAAEAGSATGTFRITRTGETSSALTVNYTLSGNASAADYTPLLGGTVEIPAGEAFVDILITPVDDTDIEGPETLTLTLASGTGYVLGANTAASITITDDDVAVTITPIHAIQGSGDTSAPGTFTVEAIVVGDYQTQGSGQLRGFFIQEEDADVDADPATSEGIFVFCSNCPTAVSVGDKVRVTGASSEFFGMSQLTAATAGNVVVLSSGNPIPTPASIALPVPGVPSGDLAAATAFINAYYEKSEGMLVTFPAELSVSEYFELARYGQVVLTQGGRPHTFTAVNTPDAMGFINNEINLASRTVILDDADNRQNRPVDTPNTNYYHPVPGLSTGNFFRGGDTITNLTGVLHWSFAGQSGTDAWRIRPVTEVYSYAFTPVNLRSSVPDVQGLKVASFNVLNYFLTIDTTSSNDVGICGPSGTMDCRGADSAQELERQRTKLLAALSELDADVVGLMEMENSPGVEPLADIVAGLPGYDYIDTGVIGSDAIRVGIIYKTSTVQPVGNYAVLDTQAFVNPRNADADRNRPALAQTFEEIASGGRFTVVVNHLKSKGSGCGAGDDDTTTGQGNCTLTRTLAAQELANWLSTDPTNSGDPDVLIIGDLNSYAKEAPIVALQDAGYTDLVAAFGGPSAYGYVFDGQLGYLDHALANASLNPQVTGVAEWHINADEIPLFDYNDDERNDGEAAFEEESDTLPLYEPNAYRTSDHDPVIVGLNLVISPRPAKQSVLDDLIALRSTVTNRRDAEKLNDAIKHLTRALYPFLWEDDNHLSPRHGYKVFEEEKNAVNTLTWILRDRRTSLPKETIQEYIDILVKVDRRLAEIAIEDAIAQSGRARDIARAQDALERGDRLATYGRLEAAIEQYRNAWNHAIRAVK